MKTIQIVIHCLPREIDQLERVLNSLYESYCFVENEAKLTLDITLNLNDTFTDWDKSTLKKDYFENKFRILQNIHSWADCKFEIDSNKKCLGINDKRRSSINNDFDCDYILYLDLDLFFPKYIFIPIVQLLNQLDTNSYIIVSPQLVKLWDSSWDILVNEKFSKEDYGYFEHFDPYTVNKIAYDNLVEGKVGVKQLPSIKFGGGWFNLFSKKLLKFINIPDSLGPYGLDDTFIMMGANIMRDKGIDVQQYCLQGIVCAENIKYSIYNFNPYSNLIHDYSFLEKGRKFKQKFRENANQNFQIELNKFLNRL